MVTKKKRLTLDMDPAFQRRLKATAALKGVSMRQYCLEAIDRELDKDQVDVVGQSVPSSEHVAHRQYDLSNGIKADAFSTNNSLGESDNGVAQPESANTTARKSERFKIGELIALRDEISRGRVFSGNSVDLLREAREIRTLHLDAATSSKSRDRKYGVGELIALRDEIFGDRVLPGNSADLIREAREIREAEIEGWA